MPQIPQIKKHFNAEETIYTIGDKAESVYLIHSGKVSILSTHGLEIGTLADGEMFGEVGRVIGSPRTVTAKAKISCIIYEIDWEIVQKKLGEADPIFRAYSAKPRTPYTAGAPSGWRAGVESSRLGVE